MLNPRIIAFYLPQYHPTPDNDKWWGKGFTEWTNVGRAKPLFRGHYQPKVPADLGYYDLRLPEVQEAQAELAKEAGVEGFCYFHYWFGNGKQELEMPFNRVLKTGKPDFPFCLCWANESWHSKFWDYTGKAYSKKLLVEQKYLGQEDNIKHFYNLLPAFKDKRYITVDGKVLFMIYAPFEFKNVSGFIKEWRDLAKQNGLSGIHFVANLKGYAPEMCREKIEEIIRMGFDAVNTVRLLDDYPSVYYKLKRRILRTFMRKGTPRITKYKKKYPAFISADDKLEYVYPSMIPNWDHSPRSGANAYILTGSTPELFQRHAEDVLDLVAEKKNQIIFLKSWNEWGEGNYMEPDLKFGKGYINALKNAIIKMSQRYN